MSYQYIVSKNGEIPLPDNMCDELMLKLGDILTCEVTKNKSLTLQKHTDQTLSDAQLKVAGNLTRIIEFNPDDYN
ncbi:hypothetical protein C6Y40_15110 [Alteromonas alba]|uniref:AbrB family transcriptional regulator n=1 Tax=Alteromonas alba TaxID=2079529 RepID=A0A2S9V8E5_9ALTE|nr:hypothetical protein C6Y40_15110 [Alteromonas alba]